MMEILVLCTDSAFGRLENWFPLFQELRRQFSDISRQIAIKCMKYSSILFADGELYYNKRPKSESLQSMRFSALIFGAPIDDIFY